MSDRSNHNVELNFLSLAKGIAIFLMLWGHCIQYCSNEKIDFFEDDVFQFIYSFHMPLFMLISGFLFYYSFSKRGSLELIKHRTQGLLQPIVMFSFIHYYLTTGLRSIHPLRMDALTSGAWLENLSSLWFLWSLLTSTIIVSMNLKTKGNVLLRIMILLFSIFLLFAMPCATNTIFMFPYFLAGFFFSMLRYKYKEKIDKWSQYPKYGFLLLFPLMLCFYEKKHYIYTTGLYSQEYTLPECIQINLFRWAIGFAGSIFILFLLELLYKYAFCTAIGYKFGTWLQTIGNYSLQIYCISVLVLSSYLRPISHLISEMLDLRILPQKWLLYDHIITPAIAIFYVLIIMFMIKILEKTKLSKLIFGR